MHTNVSTFLRIISVSGKGLCVHVGVRASALKGEGHQGMGGGGLRGAWALKVNCVSLLNAA